MIKQDVRTLWDCASDDRGNSAVVRITGSDAVKSGQIKIFWPTNESGDFLGGAPVVEFRALTDGGHDVSGTGSELDGSTIDDFTFTVIEDAPERGYKIVQVDNTGNKGLVRLTVIFTRNADNTWEGILERVRELESTATVTVPVAGEVADLAAGAVVADVTAKVNELLAALKVAGLMVDSTAP